MKKFFQNRIFCLLLGFSLLVSLAVPACAHIVPDTSQTGSISITMSYEGNPVSGGTLTVYRVGEITENDGNYSFSLTDEFTEAGVSLDTLDSELAETLAAFAEEQSLTGTTANIGDDGTVTIENLSTGLYLIIQTTAAEGYNAISPFLVSIPVEEDGAYVYDVDASPKMSALTEADTSSDTSSTTSSEDTSSDDTSSEAEKLPQTGQHNLPVVILTISGLALMLAGLAIRTKSDEK